jgi:hypothetical protein
MTPSSAQRISDEPVDESPNPTPYTPRPGLNASLPTPDDASAPHIIRLRGPWERVADSSVSFRRPFNWPRAAIAGAKLAIELVIAGAHGAGQVTLNDRPLGEISPSGQARFAVTGLLAMHNVLMIEFPQENLSAEQLDLAAIGDVRLEILEDD